MKITLEDELGNIETISEKLSEDYILNGGAIQNFFTICIDCGKVVLSSYTRTVGKNIFCNHCNHCKKIVMKYRKLEADEIVQENDEVKGQLKGAKNKYSKKHTYAGMKVSECKGYKTGLPRIFRRAVTNKI